MRSRSIAAAAVVAALGLAACGSNSHRSTAGALTPGATVPAARTPTTTSAGTVTGTTSAGAAPSTPSAATTGNSSADVAAFRNDIVKAQRSGHAIGPLLTATIQKAGKMTDAELVQRFSALARKVSAYGRSVSHFTVPQKFEDKYALVVEGFRSLASDLANIAQLGAEHEGTAQGKVAVAKLYEDLTGLSQAETSLDKAAGLPA